LGLRADGEAFDSKNVDQEAANAALREQRGGSYGHTLLMDKDGCVIVPPNHVLIFEHGLVHKVNKTTTSPTVGDWRQFVGWQVLERESPTLRQFVEFVMRKGAVFPLPSGQMPRIYSVQFTNTNLPRWVNDNHLLGMMHDDPRQWGTNTYDKRLLFSSNEGTIKETGEKYIYPLPLPVLPSIELLTGKGPLDDGGRMISIITGIRLGGGKKRAISDASTVPQEAQEVL
jgi:hypothetical protein